MKKPLVLIIMDGYGINSSDYGNAIRSAKTENLDRIMSKYPHTEIGASGLDVGLPNGQMGNSEVGHTNIGAGRIVYQELTRISKSIADGDFFTNHELKSAITHCKEKGSALHLMGLLSDGGVHSHIEHLFALLQMADNSGLEKVYVHCFLDGRDVPPSSGKGFVESLWNKLEEMGKYKIATVMGRYYAMDRDNRFDRVEKAYRAITNGIGTFIENPVEAVEYSYGLDKTDEFVEPIICTRGAELMSDDAVIFYNFRPDRARELTRAFVDDDFVGFDRGSKAIKPKYICMTQYDLSMPNVEVAFKPQSLDNTFGEYISSKGFSQLRIAETEKYAHVTFFFNGGVEEIYPLEDRALIKSPDVATYDLAPTMSAVEVTEECLKRLDSGKYDVVILNFANCDMVGHTGFFDAAVTAVQTVDIAVGRIVDKALEMGGIALITADHGNAEQMYDENGKPFTAHTTNMVPFVVVGKGDIKLRNGGKLADIAPTMLEILGIEKPTQMTGETLISQN